MVRKVEAWKCEHCNSLHNHPSLAEKCEVKCEWYNLFEDNQDKLDSHPKLERRKTIDNLKKSIKHD